MRENSEKIAEFLGFKSLYAAVNALYKKHRDMKIVNDMLGLDTADRYPQAIEDIRNNKINRISNLRGVK